MIRVGTRALAHGHYSAPQTGVSRLLQRVVAPIHQGVAPARVLYIAVRPLGQVAVDVAGHARHVAQVVLRVPRLLLAQELDDPSARLAPY